MTDKLGIGIVGIGRIGKLHAEALTYRVPRGKVVAVSDPIVSDPPWLDDLGIKKRFKDHKALLSDMEVQAVYVCSSTDTHAQIVMDAAKAGKHVFCEKPIDLDATRVQEALAAVEAAGVKLQVGFNRRFDHNHARAAEAVRNGRVGDVHLIKVTSRDPAPPPLEYVRVSGGLFLDMMIHDFDMVRFLSASEVVAVHAAGTVLVDPEIGKAGDIDTAIVTLWLENGALAVIDNSRKAVYGYDQRTEVFGSKGVVLVGNDTPSQLTVLDDSGATGDKPLYFFLERYGEAFVSESAAFVEAVLDTKPLPVSGRDGLAPVHIAMAAKKSLEEGRRVEIHEVVG